MRMLHTMLRVADLKRSHRFYCDLLGMKELRREDYPGGKFTLSFVGYGEETEQAVIELTYNYGKSDYTHGSAFGHIALQAPELGVLCERLSKAGVTVLRQPGPMAHRAVGRDPEIIAFVEDPDGYRIELIQAL